MITNPDDPINVVHIADDLWKDGLTKREYFAALAMQGFLAADLDWEAKTMAQLAPVAVQYADALIHELNKPRS